MKKEKILLVDVLNLYTRNFVANQLSDDDGNHLGGVLGSIMSLRSVVEKIKPKHIICCWEGKGSSERRRKILQEYKAGRKWTGLNRKSFSDPELERISFKEQITKLKVLFSYLPIHQLSVDYLEADDMIAYSCKKILKNQYQKVILSTDRDYFQLIDDDTQLFRPIKSKANPNGEMITKDYMIDELKCYPSNWILVKCATGDSDNIDGVKNEAKSGKKPRGIGSGTFIKDFPFLVDQKTIEDKKTNYEIEDIIKFAQEQKEPKYQKYCKPISVELLKRNQELIQLLDPDISMTSTLAIERILKEQQVRLNSFKFRLELSSIQVSNRFIDSWLDTFAEIIPLNLLILGK